MKSSISDSVIKKGLYFIDNLGEGDDRNSHYFDRLTLST